VLRRGLLFSVATKRPRQHSSRIQQTATLMKDQRISLGRERSYNVRVGRTLAIIDNQIGIAERKRFFEAGSFLIQHKVQFCAIIIVIGICGLRLCFLLIKSIDKN
jgi:hypothetical protein